MTALPWARWHFAWWRRAKLPLSLGARGLLGQCWDAHWDLGALPVDPVVLARATGCTPDEIAEHWPEIEHLFEARPEGLVCADWQAEREHCEHIADQRRKNGQQGGRRRGTESEPAGYPAGNQPGDRELTGRGGGSEPGYCTSPVREETDQRRTAGRVTEQEPAGSTPASFPAWWTKQQRERGARDLDAFAASLADVERPAFGDSLAHARWLDAQLVAFRGKAAATASQQASGVGARRTDEMLDRQQREAAAALAACESDPDGSPFARARVQ